MCGASLLSVSRQVGAHLWHKGPVGGLQQDSNPQPLNTFVSRGEGSTTEPSSTPSPSIMLYSDRIKTKDGIFSRNIAGCRQSHAITVLDKFVIGLIQPFRHVINTLISL